MTAREAAEAMREAAAKTVERHPMATGVWMAKVIRALPLPADPASSGGEDATVICTGADTSALTATGLWKSRNAAAVYEHVDVSEEARKADLLPTRAASVRKAKNL
jgi:hypothetical protein